MPNKPAKNTKVSWEGTQAFSVWILFVVRPDIESILTLTGTGKNIWRLTAPQGYPK